jgi:hypothetical protein
MFEAKRSTPQMIEDLYLSTFSRYPTPQEIATAAAYIDGDTEPRKATEDLLWTLLNSREFLFNH